MSRRLDEDPAELRHRRGKAAFDEVLDREPGQRFIIEEEDRDIAFGMDGVQREKGLRDRQPQKFPETRSEEHTSELQSLMRISYAVFCLKNKKTITLHISKLQRHYKSTITP